MIFKKNTFKAALALTLIYTPFATSIEMSIPNCNTCYTFQDYAGHAMDYAYNSQLPEGQYIMEFQSTANNETASVYVLVDGNFIDAPVDGIDSTENEDTEASGGSSGTGGGGGSGSSNGGANVGSGFGGDGGSIICGDECYVDVEREDN